MDGPMNLSEAHPTTAIDTVSEFKCLLRVDLILSVGRQQGWGLATCTRTQRVPVNAKMSGFTFVKK